MSPVRARDSGFRDPLPLPLRWDSAQTEGLGGRRVDTPKLVLGADSIIFTESAMGEGQAWRR